jgi:hypothetical protein
MSDAKDLACRSASGPHADSHIILAMEQSEVPSGLESQIDRLRKTEKQSPSIVPLMRNGDL